MSAPPTPPTAIHPDLSMDRLQAVANLIDDVWVRTRESHNEEEGDGLWGFGCRLYDRLRTRLRWRSVDLSWLRIIEGDMHFVFTVGSVPVRFYRGRARRVKVGYLNRRAPELQQQQLAFGMVAREMAVVYRIAVEASFEDKHPRIVLVRQTLATGESAEVFEIDVTKSAKRTAPSFRKPPVPIQRPVVAKKRPKKQTKDNEGA